MKLHNAVQNEAILSNVGEVGEFRIRNSAKAFNILSSGLYANKIKAVIRELSCNAVDSHIAAGKTDTPFDIHLPNSLEPWFSIRDYGIGLNHDQVTNLYTTYFESTKTDSNEFIGALGLGSKSPFSYTENFTVTAIKDGRKGIYTAFINEQGVPSIALMMEEETADPTGVEVRFAVEDRYDFDKFRSEARAVYEYFKLRPVVSGNANFTFVDPTYKDKDIIPGVHYIGFGCSSYAIMGNIKYPIQIPSSDKVLGNLDKLLSCGLVMEFDIGELDFQASREGLSYIPATVDAIKSKLEKLNDRLSQHLAEEVNKIENSWDRAIFIYEKRHEYLWEAAVRKYVTDNKPELIGFSNYGSIEIYQFKFDDLELPEKYNIDLRVFSKQRSYQTCHTEIPYKDYNDGKFYWKVRVTQETCFVITDTKVGAVERAKYHWRTSQMNTKNSTVYVISAHDKTKPVKTEEFFKLLKNPPQNQIFKASELLEKERAKGIGKNVTILAFEERKRGRWSSKWVWAAAGKLDSIANNADGVNYYVEMNGWTPVGLPTSIEYMRELLSRSGIYSGRIYGVRKADLDAVKALPNWVDLKVGVTKELEALDTSSVMGLVKKAIDFKNVFRHNAAMYVSNKNSPYLKLYNTFATVKDENETLRSAQAELCKLFNVKIGQTIDPTKLIKQYETEVKELKSRYSLLDSLRDYAVDNTALGEYINIVDATKGV